MTWQVQAQAQAPTPAKKEAEDDGPFAPKGKTGKLREEEQAANAPKPEPEAPPPKEKPYGAGVDIVYGLGRAGGGTDFGSTPTKFKVASIMLGVFYQADPKINARLRCPISTGSNDDAGYSATAAGNVELGMTYIPETAPNATTRFPLDIGLYLPTASGDRFPPPEGNGRERAYYVNTFAQWSRGMEDDAFFAPHRLSLVPKVSLRYASGGIATGGYVKIPLMVRMGGGDPSQPPPSDDQNYTINSFVFQTVVGGDFRIDISKNKVDIGTKAWLTFMTPEYVTRNLDGSTPPSKVQFALEPQVRAAFGNLKTAFGVILPIGGRLAGPDLHHTYGFRLSAVLGF
ncbi:MAG: hypothetical protein ABW133_14285 [Polyangiaceae bacterium]